MSATVLSAPMIAGFVAFATLAFAFAIFHIQTLREENAKAWRQKIVEQQNVAKLDGIIEEKLTQEELESVETSQTLRTAKERFEEQYEARMQRVHLITFKATAEEAEWILENSPDSEYLYNLADSELDGHVCQVRLARARSLSTSALL